MVRVVLDEQKSAVDKEASGLRASLREVEKARLDGRRDLHDVKRQLKNVQMERNKLRQDVDELKVRVRRHEERTELARREHVELKQKVPIKLDYLDTHNTGGVECNRGVSRCGLGGVECITDHPYRHASVTFHPPTPRLDTSLLHSSPPRPDHP